MKWPSSKFHTYFWIFLWCLLTKIQINEEKRRYGLCFSTIETDKKSKRFGQTKKDEDLSYPGKLVIHDLIVRTSADFFYDFTELDFQFFLDKRLVVIIGQSCSSIIGKISSNWRFSRIPSNRKKLFSSIGTCISW